VRERVFPGFRRPLPDGRGSERGFSHAFLAVSHEHGRSPSAHRFYAIAPRRRLSAHGLTRSIDRMARTLYLRTAYDGGRFHGWQTQTGVRTVQSVLEDTLRRVLRHPVDLIGCGRTDAGVHAAGHVSHVVTTHPLRADRLKHAIGSRLPDDVALLAVHDVHPWFDARGRALSKLYRYRIHNRPDRPAEHQTQRHTYHCWRSLDVERMREAARHFIGEMDFSAMAAAGCQRETMVRRVIRCDVERHLDEVRIDVEGTGFLYRQVRTMAGTLLNVGRGQWAPDRVAEVLAGLDRREAGPCLPARGLSLQWVRYPPHLLRPPERTGDTNDAAVRVPNS